jgi:hypothetical protein
VATPTEITTRLAVGEPPSGTSTREGARTVGIGMQVIIAGIRHLRIPSNHSGALDTHPMRVRVEPAVSGATACGS